MSVREDAIALEEQRMTIYTNNEVVPPYSVKIEQTAKGARVTVHVSGTRQDLVMIDAVALYRNTREKLQSEGFIVAAEETK